MEGTSFSALFRPYFAKQSDNSAIDRDHGHRSHRARRFRDSDHHDNRHRTEAPQPQRASIEQSSEGRALTASQTVEAGFTIVTKEGDKVSISGSSQFNLDYTSYNATGQAGRQVASGQSLSVSYSQQYQFSVEGDLSREELSDIQTLLRGTRGLVKDVFQQDSDKLEHHADKLDDLDSLASFDGQVSVSRSVGVVLEHSETSESTEENATPTLSTSEQSSASTAVFLQTLALSLHGSVSGITLQSSLV